MHFCIAQATFSGTDGPPLPPLRCCSRWGLQSSACRQADGELLPRLSTLTSCITEGGLFLLHFP